MRIPIISGLFRKKALKKSRPSMCLKIGKIKVHCEIARSFLKQAKGLMFRSKLDENTGMLFDFKKEGKPSMWMFGMRFPIDFIFLDQDMNIVGVSPYAMPFGFRTYSPKKKARYVIEVNAGFCEANGVKEGQYAIFC